jgi:hypothetical protein
MAAIVQATPDGRVTHVSEKMDDRVAAVRTEEMKARLEAGSDVVLRVCTDAEAEGLRTRMAAGDEVFLEDIRRWYDKFTYTSIDQIRFVERRGGTEE